MKKVIERMSLVDAVDSTENSEMAELLDIGNSFFLLRAKSMPRIAFLINENIESACHDIKIKFNIKNYGAEYLVTCAGSADTLKQIDLTKLEICCEENKITSVIVSCYSRVLNENVSLIICQAVKAKYEIIQAFSPFTRVYWR
jgi:hypothetical protein